MTKSSYQALLKTTIASNFMMQTVGRPVLPALLLMFVCIAALPGFAAPANGKPLAATPPMGWNDWAHYQCGYTAQTILDNAKALVKTGLAARRLQHGDHRRLLDAERSRP